MSVSLVERMLNSEQVARIFNGMIQTEEQTVFVVHIYPAGCNDCESFHTTLLHAVSGMEDENMEIYSFPYKEEAKDPPIVTKLLGTAPEEHACIMICTIKRGIRKKMSILTGKEIDSRFPLQMETIPRELFITTLQDIIRENL